MAQILNAEIKSGEAGYTLLELLVAIAVIALLALPLSRTVSFSLKAWRGAHGDVEAFEEFALVRARLRTWLMAAYFSDPARKAGEVFAPMSGTSSSLNFIAPISPDGRADDLYRVTLRFDQELNTLILSMVPDHFPSSSRAESDLISDLSLAQFSYLTAEGEWLDEWTAIYEMPEAVKITMQSLSGSASELIVPMLVEEWADCAFDSESEVQNCLSGVHSS